LRRWPVAGFTSLAETPRNERTSLLGMREDEDIGMMRMHWCKMQYDVNAPVLTHVLGFY
jgi:hypothetical protein